jgi:hypothetical protein
VTIPVKGLVLDRGPSDHSPFVKPLWYAKHPDAPPVTVGFWNVEHSTNERQARPTFEDMLDLGVDLLILNEVKARSGIVDMLHDDLGLGIRWHAPEFAIAWSRARFGYLHSRPLVMSPDDYWLDQNEALAVVLLDHESGSQLKAVSEHPPAHISRAKDPTFDKVLAVHRDVGVRNALLAKHSRMPLVIGRDSNIDPVHDRPVYTHSWGWAYPKALDYVRSPAPTRGKVRHIDELLTRGLLAEPPKKEHR